MVSAQFRELLFVALVLALCTCFPAVEGRSHGGRIRGIRKYDVDHNRNGRLLRTNPNHIPVINEGDGDGEAEVDDEEEEKSTKYKDNTADKGGGEDNNENESLNEDLILEDDEEDKSEKYKDGNKASKWMKTKACKKAKGKKKPEGNLDSTEIGEPCEFDVSQIAPESTNDGMPSEPTIEPTTEPTIEPTNESQPDSTQADSSETDPPSSSNPSPSEPTNAPRPTSITTDGDDAGGGDAEPDGDKPTDAQPVDGGALDDPDAPSTQSPSPSFSPEPNMPPALGVTGEICQVLPNGSFGVTTAERLEVKFFYQVETTPMVTQDVVNDGLLPLLESGLGGRLLASLFDECRRQNSAAARGETSGCEAQGYSSLPVDRVLNGVSCAGSKSDPSNDCFVIDAGTSLYFNSDVDCSDAVSMTKAEIKNAIDSGSFNELENRIVNITYVDESELDFSSVNEVESGDTSTSGGSNQTLPVYAWALIAVGGMFSILAVGMVVKRRRRRSRDAESTAFPIQADGIDIDCPPSISENTWYDQAGSSEGKSSEQRAIPNENETLLPQIESQDDILFLSRTESTGKEGDEDIVVDTTELDAEAGRQEDADTDSSPLDSKSEPEQHDDIPSEVSFPPEVEDTSGEDTDEADEESTKVMSNTQDGREEI